MKGYIIFLIAILLISCSEYKGEKDSVAYDRVEITFDGYGDYDIDGKLKITITNPSEIKELNHLKNESQPNWFGNTKGTEYVVRLVYVNTETNEKLLLRILKSTDSSPSIEYGSGTLFDRTYKNDQLVSYVASLIKLDAIKKYKGSLSQEEYNTLIR